MRILFADDNRVLRYSTSVILESRGHTVAAVTDGVELIQKLVKEFFAGNAYDLVVTDYNMPRMNGIEALRNIRADSCFKTLRFIVYSADNLSDEEKAEIETLGGVLIYKLDKDLLVAVNAIAADIAKEKR